jgi:hypothetical protein
MMTLGELLAEVPLLSPATVRAAQAAHGDDVGAMLGAGADSVFTRQIPPCDVAETFVPLLQQSFRGRHIAERDRMPGTGTTGSSDAQSAASSRWRIAVKITGSVQKARPASKR